MAELIIQPWDKEYWSKGARKRLYDEYQTNAMDRRLAEAEGMEGMNRASTEMTDVRRHGQTLERDTRNYNNRLAEMGLGQGYDLDKLKLGSTLRREEMDVGYGHDSALAEKQIQARANENALARAAARSDFDYQADKKKRDIMGVLTDRYKLAYKADNPNMATGDLEMQAALDAENAYNALQDTDIRGNAAIDVYKMEHPEAFAPGVGSLMNANTNARKAAMGEAIATRLLQGAGGPAPLAPGSQFPSSSVPVIPGVQGGPRALPWPPKTKRQELNEKYGVPSR